MPLAGFEPGSLSERLLEFDTRSKPLGHHGRFYPTATYFKEKFLTQLFELKTYFNDLP